MGRITYQTVTFRNLELTREDLQKQEERRKRKYNTQNTAGQKAGCTL